MSFPRYENYQNTGIEWLGDVPSHWGVQSIKWLSPVLRGASPRPIDDPKYFDDEGQYAWVRIADATASNGFLLETTQILSELGSALSVRLEPGELFLSIAGTVGKPCITGIKACIHDGFVYFPSLRIPPRFLFRIFEAGHCYGGLGKMGTQLNLNTDTVGSIRVPVPPKNEVLEILAFLDRETAKIDALVEEQRRLIALLKEKRQAVISHAVTKGLNPDAPMKDSGIEWLGEIPAHWEVTRIKRISSIRYGIGEPPVYHEVGTPLFRATNVDGGKILNEGMVYVDPSDIPANRIVWLDVGDIIVVRSGAHTGDSAIVRKEHCPAIAGFDMVVKPNALCNPDYLQFCLLSAFVKEGQIALERMRAAQPHLNAEELGNCQIVLPPLDEQNRIAEFLLFLASAADELIDEAHSAVSILQERRAALISAAVTGKIDVRGLVAPPAEMEAA